MVVLGTGAIDRAIYMHLLPPVIRTYHVMAGTALQSCYQIYRLTIIKALICTKVNAFQAAIVLAFFICMYDYQYTTYVLYISCFYSALS